MRNELLAAIQYHASVSGRSLICKAVRAAIEDGYTAEEAQEELVQMRSEGIIALMPCQQAIDLDEDMVKFEIQAGVGQPLHYAYIVR
jgi:hypothetical protein